MRNHHEKTTDIVRSVLPSTARSNARRTRKLIHRAARRAVNMQLQTGIEDPVHDIRSDIGDMVWDRRSADKIAPLVRWALHHVRANPELRDAELHEQLDHFRQLLPDNTIGRHALSHIDWPLEQLHPELARRWTADPRSRRISDADACAMVRALLEAGLHRELNHRLKNILTRTSTGWDALPVLAGLHDIERFGTTADSATRHVIAVLYRDTHLR